LRRENLNAGAGSGRPIRLVIVNQYYLPDLSSTGQLLHELAGSLVGLGFEVRVITSWPNYGPRETWVPCPLRETLDGVQIDRIACTRLSKDRLIGRAMNAGTFFLGAFWKVLRQGRGDVFLFGTNPPFLGILGTMTAFLRRRRYVVLVHDVYPHIATWTGVISRGGWIEKTWHRLNRMILQGSSRIIVLCDRSKRLLVDSYGVPPDRLAVIHNWANGRNLRPIAKTDSSFAREHGFSEPFTVLYSGNLGLYYEYETLLDAAKALGNQSFRLVFVGAGGKKRWLETAVQERGLANTLILPYQPLQKLQDSLNGCDASLVTIARGIEGISFPSKLYSSLAVGKPVLALSEEDSELRSIVEDNGVGLWYAIGDAKGLAEGIRHLMSDPADAGAMGRKGRALFEELFDLDCAAGRYADVLRDAAQPV
jgi:glycosyltransferase involved in cell wall biosynthesis